MTNKYILKKFLKKNIKTYSIYCIKKIKMNNEMMDEIFETKIHF